MLKDYVCVDIETNGVSPKWSKIIEIGAVKVAEGQVVDTFSKLINPGMAIPPFIRELTHITDDMVKNQPTVETVIKEFVEFSEGYVLLGHNLQFDYSFLKQNALNNNLAFEHKGIDTLKIARVVHRELESRKLEDLCKYYGIADENHHRAFNDADITSKLYLKLCDRFGDSNPEVFEPKYMKTSSKKVQPITSKQKKYLEDLCKYHHIDIDFEIDKISRNEASRKIDKILSEKGRIFY